MQTAGSAKSAECSGLLPYVRRVAIVSAVAAMVREQSADDAKIKNSTQSTGGFAQAQGCKEVWNEKYV